jgi:hypothetical protein
MDEPTNIQSSVMAGNWLLSKSSETIFLLKSISYLKHLVILSMPRKRTYLTSNRLKDEKGNPRVCTYILTCSPDYQL